MKKLFTSVIALLVAMVMSVSSVFAATTSQFVQNLDTQNTLGYVDPEVDQFETYSEVKNQEILIQVLLQKFINQSQEIHLLYVSMEMVKVE